jgi:SpoVK/Ycf46/Vps4 family AAA+-type ATPase
MLCTCNNIDHVDAAVARRMTYKIHLKEPNLETRKKIFANRFPFLSPSETDRICTHFPLTGANVENILEKYVLLEKIGAFEGENHFQDVWEICQQELLLSTETRKPIGFNNQNHN